MPKVRPTRSIIYIYISSSFTSSRQKRTSFWNCILKHTKHHHHHHHHCFSLNGNDNDTFALSRVALDFGGKPSGDECSSIIPIKLPERQRRRGDETSAFVRTSERERERHLLDSIVPKRDGGKKKNLDAARSSLRPRLSFARISVSFERRLSDLPTTRRERTARTSRRIFFSFVLTQIILYVPLF